MDVPQVRGNADLPAPLRAARLPNGDRMVIREAVPDDADELLRLTRRLSPEDRWRRYFSVFHPDRAFIERRIALPRRGGVLLVAELHPADPDETSHIVGEAGCSARDDGDGDLDIIVDRTARGWLAPSLLDVLREQAALRGFPNLRAQMLLGNRPMLALVRARGCAIVDSEDRSVVETTMATTGDTPCWPPVRDHPRVLVEVRGSRWRGSSELVPAGIDVIACGGPSARQAVGPCPMLDGRRCPLVEGADVVVHSLPGTDGDARALLDAHGRMGTHPLVIEVGTGDPAIHAPAGAVALARATPAQLREVVDALLDEI